MLDSANQSELVEVGSVGQRNISSRSNRNDTFYQYLKEVVLGLHIRRLVPPTVPL